MFWSFIAASILIELTPGPNMTWLAVLGAARGRMTALAAVAGIAIGLAVAALVASFGLTALLTAFPALVHGLRLGGTAYLFYLAWDAWRSSNASPDGRHAGLAAAFRQGLIGNVLNPKAYLFYGAVLPQFISGAGDLMREVALLSAAYVGVATIIHGCIAILAGTAARFLESSPHAVTIRKAMAVLIALAACWFFYATNTSG